MRFLQTFVLLNLYKEIGRFLLIRATYYLTLSDLGGQVVDRDTSIVPVILYQTSMSIVFRLELSDYSDPRVALANCMLQGVLEVILRVTVKERDAWLKQVSLRFLPTRRNRRGTTLVVRAVAPASASTQPSIVLDSPDANIRASRLNRKTERIAGEGERQVVMEVFRTRMILCETWGEYAGIVISSLVLALGAHMPLVYAFPTYRKYPMLFDGGSNKVLGDIAIAAMIQVTVELATDTACFMFEQRRGLKPLNVWRAMPKRSLIPLVVWALMYASTAGQSRSLNSDVLHACTHLDMCWCVGDGLLPGGIRETYCLELYANNSGRPTA
jgi:hypothetical protein